MVEMLRLVRGAQRCCVTAGLPRSLSRVAACAAADRSAIASLCGASAGHWREMVLQREGGAGERDEEASWVR